MSLKVDEVVTIIKQGIILKLDTLGESNLEYLDQWCDLVISYYSTARDHILYEIENPMGNQQESDDRDKNIKILDDLWYMICKDLKDNKDGVFYILTRESLDDVAQIINSLEYSSLLSEKLIQEDYKKYALDPSNPKIKFE